MALALNIQRRKEDVQRCLSEWCSEYRPWEEDCFLGRIFLSEIIALYYPNAPKLVSCFRPVLFCRTTSPRRAQPDA